MLGSGTGGVLACFDDRLMVIKVGAMTSWMAGSMGGGRVTTIHYRDITSVETPVVRDGCPTGCTRSAAM